jgi:hypothetical protein
MSNDRCCGVFPLNTGVRLLCIAHILICILLIADPWSTPFSRAVVFCEETPDVESDKVWMLFPLSVCDALSLTDLTLGVAGCVVCSFILFRLESKYFLISVSAYFLIFCALRVIWAVYLGFSSLPSTSIQTYWEISDLDDQQQSVLNTCVGRFRRSAIVDIVTCLCVYLYFVTIMIRKYRRRSDPAVPSAAETVVEGVRVSAEDLALLDLNVLGMSGHFFVGKPINERILGRPNSFSC